eukprot:gene9686-10520_t
MSSDSSNPTDNIPSQGNLSNETKKMEENSNKSVGEILTQLRNNVNRFELRKTIESTRETINNQILSNSIVQSVFRLGSHTWTWRDDLDKEFTQCSTTLNNKYPAFSSFARNHEVLVISGVTLFVAIPSRRLKSFFLPLTLLTAASTKAVIWTFDYKWSKENNSSEGADPQL